MFAVALAWLVGCVVCMLLLSLLLLLLLRCLHLILCVLHICYTYVQLHYLALDVSTSSPYIIRVPEHGAQGVCIDIVIRLQI